jgi:hypothetical protein
MTYQPVLSWREDACDLFEVSEAFYYATDISRQGTSQVDIYRLYVEFKADEKDRYHWTLRVATKYISEQTELIDWSRLLHRSGYLYLGEQTYDEAVNVIIEEAEHMILSPMQFLALKLDQERTP